MKFKSKTFIGHTKSWILSLISRFYKKNFIFKSLIFLIIIRFILHIHKLDPFETDYIFILIFILLYIIIIFKINRTVYCFRSLYQQNKEKDRIYLYSSCLKNDLKKTFCSPHWEQLGYCTFIALLFMYLTITLKKNLLGDFNTMLPIFCVVTAVENCFSHPNKKILLETNDLDIGYGAALAYFKNYIELNMPLRFIERVNNFKSYHQVDLEETLFILVPESCKIHHNLEMSDENIERCQELPEEKITNGGIRERTYNITVYQILNESNKGFRMAVEYAQPLKTLLAYKKKGFITEAEMYHQRRIFVKSLRKFLQDNDLQKFCKVIEFDDSKRKVSEVLRESYCNFYIETI